MNSDEKHFALARRETIRYHEELYAATNAGASGTWLHRPHRLLAEALEAFDGEHALTVYDLGCGIGRHTFPLIRFLPAGSRIHAVDLLD